MSDFNVLENKKANFAINNSENAFNLIIMITLMFILIPTMSKTYTRNIYIGNKSEKVSLDQECIKNLFKS